MAKVLVVEDNVHAVEFYQRHLAETDVVYAEDAESAIREFLENQDALEIIVMDGTLGIQDTDELVQLIRTRGGYTGKILAASGNPLHGRKLVEVGADESLDKEDVPERVLQLLSEST